MLTSKIKELPKIDIAQVFFPDIDETEKNIQRIKLEFALSTAIGADLLLPSEKYGAGFNIYKPRPAEKTLFDVSFIEEYPSLVKKLELLCKDKNLETLSLSEIEIYPVSLNKPSFVDIIQGISSGHNLLDDVFIFFNGAPTVVYSCRNYDSIEPYKKMFFSDIHSYIE
jgi:hypothetical protein